jgi:glycosyltransferase involved in cell wall biosynthesis
MDRRIKVIHFADKFGKAGATMHGVTKLLSWWFTRWDTANFDMQLVGLRANDPGVPRLREVYPDLIALNRSVLDPRCLTDMLGLIGRHRPDVVHLHGYAAADFGRVAARLKGVPIVMHEHFVDPAMPRHQAVADGLLRRWCDHAFACSRSVGEFMVKQRSVPKHLIEVLYNGAPLADFTTAEPAVVEQLRAHWKIPAGRMVLGTVGRLDPQKGNKHLIGALARLRKQGHDVCVMIIGDGPLLEPLRSQAHELGVADRVIFAGYQSNISQLQSMFTIQVFPSLYEGTPLTLFEAMSTARPIVSTHVDGLGEILRDEIDSRVVPPADDGALADAIGDLLRNPQKRQRLALQAHAASRNYDIIRMIERMQSVYESLASGARPLIAPEALVEPIRMPQ